MKIAVVQTKPIIGDITANAVAHQKLIQLAIASHAQAVFFRNFL
jgi:predicted amidohydrolase